jgi:5'-3' exonuclease
MTEEISEEVKKEIFRLIAIPGVEISDIPEQVNKLFNTELDSEKVMEILSDEYLKHNLDFGRRLCCRF